MEPARAADGDAVQLTLADSSAFNTRYRVQLTDGARVECVLYRGDTLCVSSQVGCAVGCPFCASGQAGLARGLSEGELIGQVEAVRSLHPALARVTVSGVGEPLHNARSLGPFLAWCQRQRLPLSLTTSGGPLERLREWLRAPHNGLTLSVHAGNESTRARLVPHAPALGPLFALLAAELPGLTQRRRRKTALAYLLIDGENTDEDELASFCARAAPLGLRVHLYAYNPLPDGRFQRVDRARYEQVYARMLAEGLRVHMSSQARIEANGGCGTLIALRRPSANAR
jgi:23S rRNA (adenine2503-C2)-methyltransferase